MSKTYLILGIFWIVMGVIHLLQAGTLLEINGGIRILLGIMSLRVSALEEGKE